MFKSRPARRGGRAASMNSAVAGVDVAEMSGDGGDGVVRPGVARHRYLWAASGPGSRSEKKLCESM
jgi:hypothetical protein